MKPNQLCAIVLLISTLFCGCYAESQTPTAPETIHETTQPATLPTTEEPQLATTAPTEATEPDLSLDVAPGMHQLRFVDEGTQEYMDYCLNIPNNPERGMPLIIFLHGAVEVGHVELLHDYGIVGVTKEIYGDDYPFLLLLPCTHARSWTAQPVHETLIALIDSICNEYEVDRQRIIITGHSLGSIGTWKMISTYGDYFSAAVPVSCGIDEAIDYDQCAKVAIHAFCGTIGGDEQNFRPAMTRIVDRITEAGGNAKLTVIDGADHEAMVTAAYTKELFDWLLEHKGVVNNETIQ
jgi:predicted peptidase